MRNNYQEERTIKMVVRIREILKELPPFLAEFFRGISETTSANTRLVYVYDLRIFFTYLMENVDTFKNKTHKTFLIDDLNLIKAEDIEAYLEYLTYYPSKNKAGEIIWNKNTEKGKGRKLASVKTMFRYFFRKRKITVNEAELVDMPKTFEKPIIKLDSDEIIKLLRSVEQGDILTKKEKVFHDHNKNRDLAIITLLLGTGMRISELIGIDIEHIDFNINGVKVTRKGGNEVILYFGDEVKKTLKIYMYERMQKISLKGHEKALFLSIQNRRITDRAVQNLVKKYSNVLGGLKKISPHKLRSTYGTNLYQATGDIYLVADVLGHRDVNTTRKHYAQMDDARRKEAVKYIKLREVDV